MARSARDCLLECLENLDEDELRRFKNKLNEFPVRKGYENIPRVKLQKAEALDLTTILISYYAEEYAVKLTAKVLKAINCKDRAKELQVATRNTMPRAKPTGKGRASAAQRGRTAPRGSLAAQRKRAATRGSLTAQRGRTAPRGSLAAQRKRAATRGSLTAQRGRTAPRGSLAAQRKRAASRGSLTAQRGRGGPRGSLTAQRGGTAPRGSLAAQRKRPRENVRPPEDRSQPREDAQPPGDHSQPRENVRLPEDCSQPREDAGPPEDRSQPREEAQPPGDRSQPRENVRLPEDCSQPREDAGPPEDRSQPREEAQPPGDRSQPRENVWPPEDCSQPREDAGPTEDRSQPREDAQPPGDRSQPRENVGPPEDCSQPREDAGAPEDRSQPREDAQPPGDRSQPREDAQPPEDRSQPREDVGAPEDRSQPREDAQPPEDRSQPREDVGAPEDRSQPREDAQPPGDRSQPREKASSSWAMWTWCCSPGRLPSPPSTSGVSHLALAVADVKDHEDGSGGRGDQRGRAAPRPRGLLATQRGCWEFLGDVAARAQRRDEAAGSLGNDNRQLLALQRAMAKSVRDCLLECLENLDEGELRRFKNKLNEYPVREGYNNIPKGRLQKADALVLKDLLISFYTEEYAVQLTAEVLEAINCKDRAEDLLAATGNRPQPPNSSDVHFIERHREALIQRTTPVEPVLDKLYGSVLTHEQYQKITAKETNPEKMRELYKLMPSWDLRCKNMLYEALKAKNPHLVKDLEGQ
ncbi:COPII coat assembly protein SEC16-like [Lacerta agilis]|uniref:COPII coat assembly protein SEC16-like n=1 Tax=Lacerta agilis TaxID=80427 RepID=UPI001419E633|nr:COPII coat assembly protein SEC16-like [Lacerta agilis]